MNLISSALTAIHFLVILQPYTYRSNVYQRRVLLENTITHVGPIDDNFVVSIQQIIFSYREQPSSLRLNISSSGGSVISGITAYNFLKQLPYPIVCHNLGEVSSAAILPYLAGSIRTAEPISKFMLHPVEIPMQGSLAFFKVEETLSIIAKDIDNYASIVKREVPQFAEKHDIVDLLKHKSLVMSPSDAYSAGILTII